MLAPNYEKLLERATQRRHSETLPQAKQAYQQSAGAIYDDDQGYENRMGLFIEWFVFDRPAANGDSPLAAVLAEEAKTLGEMEMARAFEGFLEQIHGLFVLHKIKKDRVIVGNLFDGEKYDVLVDPGELMFAKNDVFQARLLPCDKAYYFSGNFCYHPKESIPFIQGEVKKLAQEEAALHKQLAAIVSKIKKLHSRLAKEDKALDKIAGKLAKGPNEKKTARLRQEQDDLKVARKNLEKEIAALNHARDDLADNKIGRGIYEQRVRLMHRLSYMNLKWERSRNIELGDIYRN